MRGQFGWDYPPGVTGNEPEIAGYTEEEEMEYDQEVREDHSNMVARLAKPGQTIIDGLNPSQADLLHMVLGIAGEAGELVDAVKKSVIYGKALDMENMVEELGDLEFYMEGLRQNLGIGRIEPLQHNLKKLSRRYPQGKFTDAHAIARADKEE